MEIYVKYLLFPYFLCFSLVLKHDFIRCVCFMCIAASPQQAMTSQIRSYLFHTGLLYSCAHFVVEIDDKSSFRCGF